MMQKLNYIVFNIIYFRFSFYCCVDLCAGKDWKTIHNFCLDHWGLVEIIRLLL